MHPFLMISMLFEMCGARKVQKDSQVYAGRWVAKKLADLGLAWTRNAAKRMPQASGSISEVVNEPFFIPLYSLFRVYGPVFKLCLGPQTFVVISDPVMAKQVRQQTIHSTFSTCAAMHSALCCRVLHLSIPRHCT